MYRSETKIPAVAFRLDNIFFVKNGFTGYGVAGTWYLGSSQVPKLKVTQFRKICHKFTAATARCQKHLHHHHDQHHDQDGGREGQSRLWRKPSFLLSSLSITVLLGTKNWAPSNTSQIPISTASVLVSVFRVGSFLELNICLGAQDGDIPQACPTPAAQNAASTVMTWRWRRLD